MFYGFNSRMIPDEVATSKPVYRKLAERPAEERERIAMLAAKKAKKRKSKSVEPMSMLADELQAPEANKKKTRGKGKKNK